MGKWEMVRLGDVLIYEQPTKYIVESTKYDNSYSTPVLTAGQTFILGYTDEKDNIFSAIPVIIFDDFTTAIQYVDFPFKVKSSAMKILRATKKADIKFLHYFLSTIKVDTGLHKRYWISRYAELQIPLPPLSEQTKIATILDKASALIALRKQQIAKMDVLVKSRFIEMFGGVKYKIVKTEEICDFITKGTTPSASKILLDHQMELIPYLKVYNLSFTGKLLFFDQPQYIDHDTHNNFLTRSKVYPNDILMNIVGPPLGKFALVNKDFSEWNINQAIVIFRSKEQVNNKYLLHALMQPKTLKPFLDSAVGIRQQNLSLRQCRNIEIPLPPLPLQEKFSDFVSQAEIQKAVLCKGLENLELQYKALMQKYFER